MAGRGVNKNNPLKCMNRDIARAIGNDAHWFNLLQSLYTSVFEWTGLPDTIDVNFMEMMLSDTGCVAAYEEKDVGIICLPAQTGGALNIYGYPTQFITWGMNGYSNMVPLASCVPCYDNALHESPVYSLKLYAKRLAEIDVSIDVNSKNQRTPYIYACDKDQELSVKNLSKQIEQGKQAIFINKNNMSDVRLDVIQTPATYVADKLQQLKRDLLTEILNYMGVFSGTSLKSERVTQGENASNVGYIRAARNSRLNQRKQFVQKFNTMFADKLNEEVTVKYSEEALETIAAGLLKMGGDEIEQLHNYIDGDH